MQLKDKVDVMLTELGRMKCFDKRQKITFWILDKNPCLILDEPNRVERLKSIEVMPSNEPSSPFEEIGFIAVDNCLIQESNCDFVLFKKEKLFFCEAKMNMTAKDKLEDNVEKAMSQIEITKQFFNEKLFGLGKIEAFIGVPAEFTKNPTSTQKIEKDILKNKRISVKIGHKISL